MNKIKYITHILTVIIFFSCTEEELFKNKEEIEVTAGFATTRTTFTEDNGTTHVTWNTEDAIGLFTKEQSNLIYKALSAGNNTKFEATGERLKAIEGETVYAYYPYSYGAENQPIVKLPNSISQFYQESASKLDFIYASSNIISSKLSLQFKHAFAFLKITIPLELIADRGKNGGLLIYSSEEISCDSYFDLEKEEITSNKSNVIRYYMPTAEELGNTQDVTCYIAILPQTENAVIRISSFNNDYILTKKAPLGGFKAGNVYTLYLNETGTDIARDALIAFYKATNGDNWINNTNWCSDKPINKWHGIETDARGVFSIDLENNNLSGKLPEELGNIKELRFIYLANNKLTGEIPSSIGNTDLRGIYLHNNELSGNIPMEIGELANLMYLTLSNNKLSNSIPKTIGNLTKLQYFRLENNRLTGNIPPEIGNMISLETFDIGNYTFGSEGGEIEIGPGGEIITNRLQNQISGSIPKELCALPNLKNFGAINNLLSGELPPEIWSLPKLEALTLSGNNFSGALSEDIGKATNLRQLWLDSNNFSGELPPAIIKLVNLEELILSQNNFSGELPQNIGLLSKLKQLECSNNLLTGEIPTSICDLVNLERLDFGNADMLIDGSPLLTKNKIEGEIPINIGNLKKLESFNINKNEIGGIIPKSIIKLTNLGSFNADNNKIKGNIPENVGNLKKLKTFSISRNNIEGNIPEEFADLPELQNLMVNNNRLHGLIPHKVSQSPKWQSWHPEVCILPQQKGYVLTIE